MLNIIGKETEPISLTTLKDTVCFFVENEPDYKFGDIIRASNHPKDKNLYMIYGKDKNNKYAVWTHWNIETNTLKGYYKGIDTFEEIKEIMRKNFFDINEE